MKRVILIALALVVFVIIAALAYHNKVLVGCKGAITGEGSANRNGSISQSTSDSLDSSSCAKESGSATSSSAVLYPSKEENPVNAPYSSNTSGNRGEMARNSGNVIAARSVHFDHPTGSRESLNDKASLLRGTLSELANKSLDQYEPFLEKLQANERTKRAIGELLKEQFMAQSEIYANRSLSKDERTQLLDRSQEETLKAIESVLSEEQYLEYTQYRLSMPYRAIANIFSDVCNQNSAPLSPELVDMLTNAMYNAKISPFRGPHSVSAENYKLIVHNDSKAIASVAHLLTEKQLFLFKLTLAKRASIKP